MRWDVREYHANKVKEIINNKSFDLMTLAKAISAILDEMPINRACGGCGKLACDICDED